MFIRKSLTACLAVCTTLGVSASLTAGTTQFLESFDYENGTKAASQPLPWKLVLDHSSSLGVQDGVLYHPMTLSGIKGGFQAFV